MADCTGADVDDRIDETPPQGTSRWCSWHEDWSGTAVLVRIIEQGSGPGWGLYACGYCRELHGLTPVAEIPVADLVKACR
jgi:hypothetical protein